MNIGFVIVTHGKIAEELLKTCELILKQTNWAIAVCVETSENTQFYTNAIQQAITKASDGKDGVLILTDLFGSTPSNLCLPFLKKNHVELISGVNLPMLLKLATLHQPYTLSHLIAFIKDYTQRHIIDGFEVIKK